jgi:hypothetical protein
MFQSQSLFRGAHTLAALLASGIATHAQEIPVPKYEVGLNYSWLHGNSANHNYQRTGRWGRS